MKFLIFTCVGVAHLLSLGCGETIYKNDISQRTFQEIKEEIASYKDVAKAIINLAVYGKYQNRSYERLALLVDTVGPRLSGSENLEKAIQIMYKNLQEDGLENVHLEPVRIPHWERGEESAVMLAPRIHRMAILGLGSSIGTPPEGITAEVLVVSSFNELQRRASEARGKIVVYNQPYISYATTVQYRVQGAVEAAKVGALASLIRSVASFSIYSPHTGIQEYQDGVPKIPTACITVEDAEMLSRMALRGNKIVIQLKMGAKSYPDTDSFNTIAEIVGSKYPEQLWTLSASVQCLRQSCCLSMAESVQSLCTGSLCTASCRHLLSICTSSVPGPSNYKAPADGPESQPDGLFLSGSPLGCVTGSSILSDQSLPLSISSSPWHTWCFLIVEGLRPKRTLRLVLWTAEEQGGVGAFQYFQLHKINISNYSLVMESDQGTFLPTGLQFTGSEKARAIMEEVMKLLQPLNITQLFRDAEGTDINFWIQAGVPVPRRGLVLSKGSVDSSGTNLIPMPQAFWQVKLEGTFCWLPSCAQ
ncbi:Plasma glutamate carboxypeptidase [Fukomys damarensis]|uniref:Carboxypeptidase Q n=1 Tax=Fukomys damarensis TaxID=885580 RepID=A0A091DW13_FUKDA|nr:Plasma glutamate carboxypeptidase [Fukomys damarensis]